MGGDYYEREVYTAPKAKSGGSSYSTVANNAMSSRTLHKSCNPQRWKEETMKCEHKNPIVFSLDVTGSMGNWTKICYDKLPMFYGQVMMQKYLDDPAISFCGIGDVKYDTAPLQCTEFGQGKQIDQLITKIYLEGGGGGNREESYDLCSYFYLSRVDISASSLPFFFITGDENYFKLIQADYIRKTMGRIVDRPISTKRVFDELKKKFKNNVYLLKKPYGQIGGSYENEAMKNWEHAIGRTHILRFENPKAVIDIMLGVIALRSGKRTLGEYIQDMKNRGQDDERIKLVKKVLEDAKIKPYNEKKEENEEIIDFQEEEEGESDDDEEKEDDVFLKNNKRRRNEYVFDIEKVYARASNSTVGPAHGRLFSHQRSEPKSTNSSSNECSIL